MGERDGRERRRRRIRSHFVMTCWRRVVGHVRWFTDTMDHLRLYMDRRPSAHTYTKARPHSFTRVKKHCGSQIGRMPVDGDRRVQVSETSPVATQPLCLDVSFPSFNAFLLELGPFRRNQTCTLVSSSSILRFRGLETKYCCAKSTPSTCNLLGAGARAARTPESFLREGQASSFRTSMLQSRSLMHLAGGQCPKRRRRRRKGVERMPGNLNVAFRVAETECCSTGVGE